MCMEDVRNMRESTSGQTLVSVGASSVELVSPSAKRVSLIIGTPNTNDVTLSLNNPAVAGNGILLQVGQSEFRLSLMIDGDLVTKGIYAICGGGTEIIAVWEASLDKE